jgi:hypothetical protein
MLLDHRTYTVRAGCLRKQIALYEKHGLAAQKRHFGEPLAWLVAETGDVNSYVHIWVYEDAADRSRRRAPFALAYQFRLMRVDAHLRVLAVGAGNMIKRVVLNQREPQESVAENVRAADRLPVRVQ